METNGNIRRSKNLDEDRPVLVGYTLHAKGEKRALFLDEAAIAAIFKNPSSATPAKFLRNAAVHGSYQDFVDYFKRDQESIILDVCGEHFRPKDTTAKQVNSAPARLVWVCGSPNSGSTLSGPNVSYRPAIDSFRSTK